MTEAHPLRLAVAICVALLATSTAIAAPPSCEEFKARLAKAERALGVPVPMPIYEDEGELDERHDWALKIKGIEGELSCRLDGRFYSLQLSVIESDKYIAARTRNLMFASLWAYTQWPRARLNRALTTLLEGAVQELTENRIRGEHFDQGTGSIDLETNVTASVYGGQDLRIGMMIDASTAK